MCAVAPATPGCREIRHSGWQSDIRLISAVDVDFTSRVYPGVQPSFEWANFAVPLVYQHAGDTRRAGFVRSGTIENDIAVGRQSGKMLIDLFDIDGERAGYAPRVQRSCAGRTHIDHQRLVPLLHHVA